MTPSAHFFEEVYQNFLASASQRFRKSYQLAGSTFCLEFAGDSLVEFLTPALAHLEIEIPLDPDLTICIWEGISAPPMEFPWPRNSQTVRGKVIGYNSDRIYTLFSEELQILQLYDKERKLALYRIQDRRKVPWWVGTSPLVHLLDWWTRTGGHQLAHAAAVGYAHGGVLLSGKSGSGKSTTALSCMEAGMQYVSEDYCILSNTTVYSLYNSAKIEERTLSAFPRLRKYIENGERPSGDKAFFFHHRFQPERILLSCPLKALIALTIDGVKQSRLEEVPPRDAIASLAATTLWQLSHTDPSVFIHLKRVAEALPCYVLHLGADLTRAPQLIGKLL